MNREPTLPRHAAAIERVRTAMINVQGVTADELRQDVYDAKAQAQPLGAYLEKVRDAARTITDDDVAALRASGYSEDAIVELTITAAAGAAGRRYDAALKALRGS
jgi:alkylhydroperoxidase family enzyme